MSGPPVAALAGGRVLIAGASGDFGGALARALSAAGARLVPSGRDEARLAARAAEVGGAGVAPADLREPEAAARIVAEAHAALGGLDAVVNAAGAVAFGPVGELADDVLAELIEINLLAPIRLTRAALARLAPGGVVVNISAVVAELPTAGMAAYSASKAALTAFDRAAAREARRLGLRVLDVRPPHMRTDLASRALAGTPPRLDQGADPDRVARVVVAAIADRPSVRSMPRPRAPGDAGVTRATR